MSVHFTVSGLTRNLFHSLGLDHQWAPSAARPRAEPVAGMLSGRPGSGIRLGRLRLRGGGRCNGTSICGARITDFIIGINVRMRMAWSLASSPDKPAPSGWLWCSPIAWATQTAW